MHPRLKLFLLLTMPILLVVIFSFVNERLVITSENSLALIIENNAIEPYYFPERTKTTNCQVRGPLPDPDCTPGAIFPGVDRETICVKGYTKIVRNVSISLKKKIYEAYGFAYPQETGSFEADHLIPLELGGSNDFENLFPESALPRPGYKEKDLVENYLNHEVCAGRLSLSAAQQQIAKNWLTVYENLSPNKINELKKEFAKY